MDCQGQSLIEAERELAKAREKARAFAKRVADLIHEGRSSAEIHRRTGAWVRFKSLGQLTPTK